MSNDPSSAAASSPSTPAGGSPLPRRWYQHEDWLAVLLGGLLLAVLLATAQVPSPDRSATATDGKAAKPQHAWAGWVGEPAKWSQSIQESLTPKALEGSAGAGLIGLVVFGLGMALQGRSVVRFLPGYLVIFALALLATVLAQQAVIRYYSLATPLWAVVLGLLVSNTVGVPGWLRQGLCTEFYIKTGLVLLGASILIEKLVAIGPAGILISWVVTPIVLVSTFWFGQRILRLDSPTLNMTISADMSVCGTSAAIATAAACRAKREELTLAVSLSMLFTVVMMIVMPLAIKHSGMNPIVGGAWIGGTVDATGAVAAAGKLLDNSDALDVATTVKLIQNILIGVIAFAVSVYWVTVMERDPAGGATAGAESRPRPGVGEIWRRFPKFILGFVAASLVFSYLVTQPAYAPTAQATLDLAKIPREWFFSLTFVSIGLETNFRDLFRQIRDGKALLLYVCGQCLNLALTLAMAWLTIEQLGLLNLPAKP